MSKIRECLESKLINPRVTERDIFITKQNYLNDNTILAADYNRNNGRLDFMRIGVKYEVANSISENTITWYDDPSIAIIFSYALRSGELSVHSYDYETGGRSTTLVYYPTDIDGTYDIDKDKGDNNFETIGQVSEDEIVSALEKAQYRELATGEIKQSNKQM